MIFLNLSLNLGIAIGEGDTFGVHMQETFKENLVKNLLIKNVTTDGSTIGAQLIFTFGFEISNSVFTKNTYYGLLTGTGWIVPGDNEFGLTFPVGGNGVISDCRFDENHGLNGNLSNPENTFIFNFVSSISNNEVSNVIVSNCYVQNNSNNGLSYAANNDGTKNIKWVNCVITETQSVFEAANGLTFTNVRAVNIGDYPILPTHNITVENCTSTNHTSLNGSARGFSFGYVEGGHISNCNASGSSGNFNSIGFLIVGNNEARTSFLTFTNNTAERNGFGNQSISSGFAILSAVNDIVLKDNIANGNGVNVDSDFAYGTGILVQLNVNDELSNIYNINIDNCTCNGNSNGNSLAAGISILNPYNNFTIPPISNVAIENCVLKFNNGYGILIEDFGINGIVGVSVNETEIYQNEIGGLSNSPSSNTIFASRNMSYLNGLGGNYNGIPLNTIVEGTTSDFPNNPGMKNISIINA
jgi:hypothetical protein